MCQNIDDFNRVPEALKPAQKTLGDRLVGMAADLAGTAAKETVAATVQAMLA